MAQTLSRDWVGYPKAEFLEKMPGTWHGAATEDRGGYVAVRNDGVFKYFELHFMFSEGQDMQVEFVVARGLNELQDLWIVARSGDALTHLRPAQGNSVSQDAKKAARILQKKFGIREMQEP